MNYNPLVATVTIALASLAALGAIIYQVVHGHPADAQLAGLAGLLFGAFLRTPGQSEPEPVEDPAVRPLSVPSGAKRLISAADDRQNAPLDCLTRRRHTPLC